MAIRVSGDTSADALCRYQNDMGYGSTESRSVHVCRVAFAGIAALTDSTQPLSLRKPDAESTGSPVYPSARMTSRAFSVRTSGGCLSGSRATVCARGARKIAVTNTAATHASSAMAARGRSASLGPEAARRSGDGVSPAASASASGSPPGSDTATSSADAGRRFGSGSRHLRMALSSRGLMSGISVDGVVFGVSARWRWSS